MYILLSSNNWGTNKSDYRQQSPVVAIDELIRQDHEIIRKCHQLYKDCDDSRDKQKYANELIRQIAIHATAEEIIVYPALESRLVRGKEVADQSLHDHLKIKHELYRLDKMNVNQPG